MLGGLTLFVGTDAHFFVDEAAHYAQIELVGQGTWLVERPFAEQDPTGRHAPMDRAQLSGEREYAPFVNHPLSVWIGVGADRIGGRLAVRAVSVLGVLGAAAAAAALSERVRAGTGPLALWLTGGVSPLVFDSQLIVAHALAAAAVGGTAVLWTSRRSSALVGLGLAAATGIAVLLRTEAILLAAAAVVVGGAAAVRGRRTDVAVRAVGTAAGALGAYLLEPVWIGRIVDAPEVGPRVLVESSRGGLEGRLEALQTVLVRPSYDGLVSPAIDVLLVVAVVFAVAGALLAVRTRLDLARPMLVAAMALAAVRLVEPAITPGLLLAFPLLTISVALVFAGVHRPRRREVASLAVAAVFAAAVAVTQYREAGGFEWGWRYVSIALPLLVPTIAITLTSFRRRLGAPAGTQVVGALVAVSLLVVASGLLEQRAVIDRTDVLLDRLDELAADTDHLLFFDPLLGRAMWQLSIDGRVVTADTADGTEVLGWMRDAGGARVLVVWVGADDLPIPGDGLRQVGTVVDLGVSGLKAATVSL